MQHQFMTSTGTTLQLIGEHVNDPTVIAACIATIVATLISLISQILFWFLNRRDKRKEYELERRRQALEKALKVIDHFFLNLTWGKEPAPNKHEWFLSDVHDSINGMFIYCKNPGRGIKIFYDALLITNPTESPATALGEFRRYVCDELGKTQPEYRDSDYVWITRVQGATKIREQ